MQQRDDLQVRGDVEMVIEYADGRPTEHRYFHNTVLRTGRGALAKSLANFIGDQYNFWISRMLFGDSGTNGGVPKYVDTNRNGLFGITRVSKPIIASVNQTTPTQVTFTSVVAFNEGNGYSLSEMALQMNTGDLYSMATFPDLGKTSLMQITWNWTLSFV